MKQPLLKALRELQAYCELILYTCLPREHFDCFLSKVPELGNIFSYVLTKEDMIFTESYLIKDLSVLLFNRSIEDIIVVENEASRVDCDLVSTLTTQPYDGTLHYWQLSMLKQSLRQLNEGEGGGTA